MDRGKTGVSDILKSLARRPRRRGRREIPGAFRSSFIVAHRGMHVDHPENSLAAFQAAAESGYPIELDVRLSKDHDPVVFHDASLKRMTGVPARVNHLSRAELERLPLHHNGVPTRETIPTLVQVLDTFRGGVIIEIKRFGLGDRGLEDAVVDLLCHRNDVYDRVIVHSFNPLAMARVASLDPRLYRSQVIGLPDRWKKLAWLKPLVRRVVPISMSRPDAVSGEMSLLTPEAIRHFRERSGYAVFGWTAGSDADIEHGRSLGLDLLISNHIPSDGGPGFRR